MKNLIFFFKTDVFLALMFLIAVFVSILVFLKYDKAELVPTFLLASCATSFSYYAYRFSKEKFRLDLMEKRWEVYENALVFCSMVVRHGRIPEFSEEKESRNEEVTAALMAAHESFMGKGLHKVTFLFGPDVQDYFNKLSKAYAFFISYLGVKHIEMSQDERSKKDECFKFVANSLTELPIVCKPYLYFGDYKY